MAMLMYQGQCVSGIDPSTELEYTDMVGATLTKKGERGLVPAPSAGDPYRFLASDGSWKVPLESEDTWKQNTANSEGYVLAGRSYPNRVWKTDSDGTPGWRYDENTIYTLATAVKDGLLSSSDYSLLRTITSGAEPNSITGIKGFAESGYRTGQVSLSSEDIGAVALTDKGVANGVAELDNTGKVPSAQLPSYVDDVIEGYYSSSKFYNEEDHTTEITPESGKIYVDLVTNKTYRWSGTIYTVISDTLALGETSTTAHRGDHGKIAYDHSQAAHARTDATNVTTSNTNGNVLLNGVESNVYTHPTGNGYNHIPSGGTKDQILLATGNGEVVWGEQYEFATSDDIIAIFQ